MCRLHVGLGARLWLRPPAGAVVVEVVGTLSCCWVVEVCMMSSLNALVARVARVGEEITVVIFFLLHRCQCRDRLLRFARRIRFRIKISPPPPTTGEGRSWADRRAR